MNFCIVAMMGIYAGLFGSGNLNILHCFIGFVAGLGSWFLIDFLMSWFHQKSRGYYLRSITPLYLVFSLSIFSLAQDLYLNKVLLPLLGVGFFASLILCISWSKGELKTIRFIILFIFLFALLLRGIGVGFNLQNISNLNGMMNVDLACRQMGVFHPDEWVYFRIPLRMAMDQDWKLDFFGYPSGHFYVLKYVYLAVFAAGKLLNVWTSSSDIHLADFYLAGRVVNVFLGSFMVLIVFILCRVLYGEKRATIAALLLAVFPFHVYESHYLTVDIPVIFWMTLSLMANVLFLEYRSKIWGVLSGVITGISIATKYNALVMMAPLFLAHFISSDSRFLQRMVNVIKAVGLMVLGFIVASPNEFFQVSKIIEGFLFNYHHYNVLGHPGAEHTSNVFFTLRLLGSSRGIGMLGLIVSILGIVTACIKYPQKRSFWVLVLFTGVLLLPLKMKVLFGRNLLPLMIPLAIFCSEGITSFCEYIGNRMRLVYRYTFYGTAAFALGITLLVPSVVFGLDKNKLDTREAASKWIEEHIPSGAVIVRETYTPYPSSRYTILQYDSFLNISIQQLRERKVQYLIACNAMYGRYFRWPKRYGREIKKYKKIFSLKKLKVFAADRTMSGPSVEIYEL